MDKEKTLVWLKKITRVLLLVVVVVIAISLLVLGAASIPEYILTPLPYTVYMIALRLVGYIGFYYYYRQHSYMPLLILVIAVSYECYLFTLYQSALEGLLW